MIETRYIPILFILLQLLLSCSGSTDTLEDLQHHFSTLASQNRWEELRDEAKAHLDDYISLNWYNLSKARTGTLTEDLFKVRQHGPLGLIYLSKGHSGNVCLAHVMFACGNIAAAQNLAFNALFTDDGYDMSLLKMLCQIEFMRGCEIVAEKYRTILLSDKVYHEWAVSASDDPEIERGRRCLALQSERFVMVDSPFEEMLDILDVAPSDSLTAQYAMSYLLLSKDLENIVSFIDKYYGTAVPYVLPTPVQEALLFFSEYNTNVNGDASIGVQWCRDHGVREETFIRFADFQQASLKNGGKSPERFRNSFWYYLINTAI